MAGSGGDVLSRGGWEIKRECEAILERHREQTGETELPAGSARTTNAGRLPAKAVIHCVASDQSHRSSSEIIRACVISALSAAVDASCRTIAMPVFGSGHAAFRFEDALETMIGVLSATAEEIDEVVIAVLAHERVHKARAILDRGTFQTCPGWGRRKI